MNPVDLRLYGIADPARAGGRDLAELVRAAAACGLLAVGIAAEVAGEAAAGPGSFATAFLDALYTLDAGTLAARARLA